MDMYRDNTKQKILMIITVNCQELLMSRWFFWPGYVYVESYKKKISKLSESK